ncbi:MAG: GWxTD domain-containing protein [Candidatus Eisenbacteria sp.]|nr:GWxTD domain-containing protein [Candidatus Eisenbacteria bacterium]
MKRQPACLGLILAILVVLLAAPARGDRAGALTCYNAGVSLLAEGKNREAIKELRRAVRKDFKFADAHAKLADAYSGLATIEGRRLAVEEYRLALRYDPENPDYHLALGKIRVDQTFDRYADTRFQEAIKLNPDLTAAYLQRGLIYIRRWLTWRQYTDDLETARGSFQEAYDRGSGDRDVFYHLAQLSLELENPETALDVSEQILEEDPEDTGARFVCAQALHDMEKLEEAEENYLLAISTLGVEEKLLFLGIEEVASRKLRKMLSKIDPDSTRELARRFWREHDPYLATKVNERLLEHWRRILKADLYFSSDKIELKGRHSSRGKSYIRYGPPTEMVSYIGENLRPNELWTYRVGGNRFRLRFEDRFMNGEFGFPFGSRGGGSAMRWEILLRQLPEFYVPEFEGKQVRMISDACSFFRHKGKTRQEIYYAIPGRDLELRKEDKGWQGRLRRRVVVYDRDWRIAAQESSTVLTHPSGSLHLLREGTLVDQIHFDLKPGTYLAAIALEDRAAEVMGLTEVGITARAFEGTDLEISDIQLARSIHRASDPSPFNKAALRVEPEPSHQFQRSHPVNLYYEIYGLDLDETGHARFRTTIRVIPLEVEEDQGFWDGVLRLFGKKPSTPPHIASTYGHTATSRSAPQHVSLDLTPLRPGMYRVTVMIEDAIAGIHTARSTVLYISR